MKEVLAKLLDGQHLTIAEAEAAMDTIMTGEATPAMIGAFLAALRVRGETIDEIAGCARSMRRHALRVEAHHRGMLMDTCGTGGDRTGTFNISTTAAFVVAGAGVPVAKHGNRSVSSQCGSADVLEALGVVIQLKPDQVARCIDEVGIGFLFAPNFHPAMRHAIGPRRELGVRTVFNILGPLTNPAFATHQVLGVYSPALTEVMAHVLREMGSRAAFVVHGADGLDEFSTTGVNRVSHLREGRVATFDLDPAEHGFDQGFVRPVEQGAFGDIGNCDGQPGEGPAHEQRGRRHRRGAGISPQEPGGPPAGLRLERTPGPALQDVRPAEGQQRRIPLLRVIHLRDFQRHPLFHPPIRFSPVAAPSPPADTAHTRPSTAAYPRRPYSAPPGRRSLA